VEKALTEQQTRKAYQSDWDAAADVWNELGRQAKDRGMKLYTDNHDAAYAFLLDAGPLDANGRPARSSGVRKLEYFFAKADPKYVFFELGAGHRPRWHGQPRAVHRVRGHQLQEHVRVDHLQAVMGR
jgi:hypothetical protein